jgi:predicted nucleic acid-binding protein
MSQDPAAAEIVRGLTVVTRNEPDFRVFDVKVLNPFSAG